MRGSRLTKGVALRHTAAVEEKMVCESRGRWAAAKAAAPTVLGAVIVASFSSVIFCSKGSPYSALSILVPFMSQINMQYF